MNLEEFQTRFDPETTNGEGPKWLRNLYFLYLLELRALAKAAPYLEQVSFYTGNETEDAEVNAAVYDLLNQIKYYNVDCNSLKPYEVARRLFQLLSVEDNNTNFLFFVQNFQTPFQRVIYVYWWE